MFAVLIEWDIDVRHRVVLSDERRDGMAQLLHPTRASRVDH
ncbi:hypothetical protein [Burkholderia cenocepacia]|nr:hypothetical protein [Burkholderia cenocepacia]